jgi:Pol polyprotein, beta-barrel domain
VFYDRARFKDFRPADVEDFLFAGSSVLPIEGYGTVDINVTVNTDTQPIVGTIQLKDTALMSTFHTNVVSLRKFNAKGVHWDTEYERLTRTLV